MSTMDSLLWLLRLCFSLFHCLSVCSYACVCVRVTSAEIRRRRTGTPTSRRCDCEIIDLHEERVIVVAVATSRAPWVVYQQPLIAHHSLQCQNRAVRALPGNLRHHGNCVLTSYGAMAIVSQFLDGEIFDTDHP